MALIFNNDCQSCNNDSNNNNSNKDNINITTLITIWFVTNSIEGSNYIVPMVLSWG